MCGIIGVIGHNKVSSLLIEGLKRLEYRGYDSAGIATLLNGKIDRRRSLGKIENLPKGITFFKRDILDFNPSYVDSRGERFPMDNYSNITNKKGLYIIKKEQPA